MAGDSTTSEKGAKEHWGSSLTMPATKVSESEMAQTTNRYTDDEWSRFIAEVQESVKVKEGKKYPCPPAASKELAKTIDHTLLKLEAKRVQFDALCAEARVDGFATVCVRPQWVQQCVANLKGSDVKVASVVGFHEGDYDLLHKIHETKQALQASAAELDIVLNYHDLQAGKYANIYTELATLRLQAPHPIILKLILETSQLTSAQVVAACCLAAAAQFDLVKTSTGFKGHGAKEEHVRLMAACCERLAANGRRMQVKASGGVRTIEDALKMIEAGASRLGTSNGVWIAKEGKEFAERGRSLLGNGAGDGERRGSRPELGTRLFTDY